MNIFIVILVLIVLIWSGIYTFSYGVWTIKENKKGGIALFILAIVSIAVPVYLLWLRR